MPDRLRIVDGVAWSGGGHSVMQNVDLARRLHPERFAEDGVPVVLRNVARRQELRAGGFVYIPQNAWPWHGPAKGRSEAPRRAALWAASEAAARRAGRTIRIGPMIPNLPRSRATLLPNALDEAFETHFAEASELGRPEWLPTEPFLLAPGSLWNYRNAVAAIEAHLAYAAAGGQRRLVLVGVARAGTSAVRHAAANNPACIVLEQSLSRTDLITAMLHADAVIFSSLVEASPVTMLEAAACERPVIAWDHSGHRFMAEHAGIEAPVFVNSVSELVEACDLVAATSRSAIGTTDQRSIARHRWVDDFIELASRSSPTRAARTEQLSSVLDKTRAPRLVAAGYDRLRPNHVRAINFHDVPETQLGRFGEQLDLLLKRFQPLGLDELRAFFSGDLRLERPGMLITFDDGLVSHATHVAQALDDRGAPGWFFIPTAGATIAEDDQLRWAIDRELLYPSAVSERREPQVFATWDQWRSINSRHVVGSHTHRHTRFGPGVPADVINDELESSFAALEREVGTTDRLFCWVGGEMTSYSRTAADLVTAAGVEFGFTTSSAPITPDSSPYRIDRTNIETTFSMARTRAALGGAADLRHSGRRGRLDAVLGPR